MSKEAKQFSHDYMWLLKMLPAFNVRYDELGQEDPRCGDRFEEMHEALKVIRTAISDFYTEDERRNIYPKYSEAETSLIGLIELPRNATPDEVNEAIDRFYGLSSEMTKVLEARK